MEPKSNNIEKVYYSFECIDIPEMFFTPHH
jgi:hypothetical protein